MRRSALIAAALMATTSASLCLGLAAHAQSSEEARIEARIAAWAGSCKNAIAARYSKDTMADISVELGATLRQSIDAGQITLKDINLSGLSYNWKDKKHSGYCNTDGKGNVTELKKL
ncbi:MAG: hypothetical protein ACKO0M_07610 [Cyanobium sp.]